MTLFFIEQAALLLALCWLLTYNLRLWEGRPWGMRLSSGCLYGVMAIICMNNPHVAVPGILLDGRDAVLAMAGLFGGPVAGVLAGLMAAMYRWWLGGIGALTGILTMAAVICAGLGLRYLVGRGWLRLNIRLLLLFGLLIYGLEGLFYFLLPADIWQAALPLFLPMLLVMIPLTVLLGLVLQDAHHRGRMQQALYTSEARLRAITGAIPDQLLVVDEDGYYQEVIYNQLAAREDQPVRRPGQRLHELFPAQEAERLLGFIRDTLASNAPGSIVYEMDTSDGRRVYEAHAQALYGPPTQGSAVVAIVRDITERVSADIEKRIAATAFDSTQGMVITDADNRILRVNRTFTDITGYRQEEVVGESPDILSSGCHSPEFYRQMWSSIQNAGHWQGEIYNRRKSGDIYPQWLSISSVKTSQGQVSHYVAVLSDISQRKENEQKINQLAFYDVLTGMANRRLLGQRLEQARAEKGPDAAPGALLLIDMDRFKNINDLWGHAVGDQILLQSAQRLSQAVGDQGTLARLGGDEFAVLLTDWSYPPGEMQLRLEQFARHLLDILAEPYPFERHSLLGGASLGLVVLEDWSQPLDRLLHQAEHAMYQAKALGKGRLCFFDSEMQAVVTRRLLLEKDLLRSLERGEFCIYLQAQICERQGLIGAEALVRWQHPKRGLLAPGAFIEVAESAGLMGRIDRQVLQLACEQLAIWAEQPGLSELTLSVNLSAAELYQPGFVDDVLALLAQTGANPARLKLELTESMLLDDMPEAIARMTQLKDRGVRFAVDDFGTGYSSLRYLQQLPLDQLKIDQSFVRALPEDNSSLAIVRTILALASSLELEVIAEGVETQAQRESLLADGCHLYQGYLFARPEPAGVLEQMFTASGDVTVSLARSGTR